MGSGKTSAIINMMNNHPEKKYLYITPFLTETDRIVENCPNIDFISPSKQWKYHLNKQAHLQELIKEDRNISITQALFTMSTEETISLIKEHNYTVIIDESVDVFKPLTIQESDYNLVKRAGLITEYDAEQSMYSVESNGYTTGKLQDFFTLARSNRIVKIRNSSDSDTAYYWQLPKELFEVSEDIYILTYMFDCQSLRYYFDLNHIEYEYVYIYVDENNTYSFSDELKYMPEYVSHLSSMIHVFENDKLNDIGKNKNALSSSWYDRALTHKSDGKIEQLRKNVANFFTHYMKGVPASGRLWSTFKKGTGAIRTKGFYNSNIEYNCKATNAYSDKKVLAYCVNIFMHPDIKNYFLQRNIDVDEDAQALSTMLQWIWRSAIRNGEEIWVYVPSKRMRNLLKDWIKNTQQLYYTTLESKEVSAIA